MTEADEAAALRLSASLAERGLPVMVGVGRTDAEEGPVPALVVYLSRSERKRLAHMTSFEGYPIVWRVSGKPRAVARGGQW